jgi:hypothetical protein
VIELACRYQGTASSVLHFAGAENLTGSSRFLSPCREYISSHSILSTRIYHRSGRHYKGTGCQQNLEVHSSFCPFSCLVLSALREAGCRRGSLAFGQHEQSWTPSLVCRQNQSTLRSRLHGRHYSTVALTAPPRRGRSRNIGPILDCRWGI